MIGWWVVRCRSKNGHLKDMCLIEIGLCAQNVLTILGSIVNILGGPMRPSYDSPLVDFDNPTI